MKYNNRLCSFVQFSITIISLMGQERYERRIIMAKREREEERERRGKEIGKTMQQLLRIHNVRLENTVRITRGKSYSQYVNYYFYELYFIIFISSARRRFTRGVYLEAVYARVKFYRVCIYSKHACFTHRV